MRKCGIYIIKNKINDLVYIGQSVDIYARWSGHKQSAKNPKDPSHNTKIHLAMYKLGCENFYIEILEECNYDELSQKEIYWINKYNSCFNGYNMTLGGESNRGETNGRALLKQEMVEDIRLAYGNHIPFREVYQKYKNIISKRGLQKVWCGETWKFVMMEVYTDQNRKWHATYAKAQTDGNKELGENNQKRACTEKEISKMREMRSNGFSYEEISEKTGRSIGVVRKYCLFQECKNTTKNGSSIQVKNLETGLVFDTQKQASLWAKCDRHLISRNKNTEKPAGIVPTTGQPAHWKSL